ncbi:hypothetical protein MMC32_007948 [Xylographa parallela]|nr:hypothetical protein [Xylographa parallela]
MARTKLNGVRDYAALFKARTGVDRHPPVNATAEELAKYHEDWRRLRAERAEVEERREEAERKKWKEVMEAFSAKMDEEEGKPRRPWYIEKEKPTLGG